METGEDSQNPQVDMLLQGRDRMYGKNRDVESTK